jgi:hypothetical protein
METDINTSVEEIDLTLDMVMRVVKLSKLQVRGIFTAVLQRGFAAGSDYVDKEAVFYLLLADMLENLQFLSSEQRLLVGEMMRRSQYDAGLDADALTSGCGYTLAFADGRYATWTGAPGWVSLDSGDHVAQIPRPPLETIAYNLDELYRRGVQIIKSRSGLNVDNSAGSVEKPGDVCERPTNPVSG